MRCIGDPEVRFCEDPVRMLRAVALAARLDFAIDPPILDAIAMLRHEIARSSPPRLLEEYYKILRAGSAEKTFRGLAERRAARADFGRAPPGAAERAVAVARHHRQRIARDFSRRPTRSPTPVLLGSLLVPLGLAPQPGRPPSTEEPEAQAQTVGPRRRPLGPRLGDLPLARRDVEQLRQLLGAAAPAARHERQLRAQRALTHRSIFREALTWLEIHGDAPELVEHWNARAAPNAARMKPALPRESDDAPPSAPSTKTTATAAPPLPTGP